MSNSRLNARRAWAARAALVVAALAFGFSRARAGEPVRPSHSANAYPTLQQALDKNPGA